MIRQYSVRFDVIRDGASLTTLQPVGAPVVDCNSDTSIKMSMSGRFLANKEIDWLRDEIKPYQIIDGIEYPVGVFPVGTFTKEVDANGVAVVSVEAYDRCLILSQIKTEGILHFYAGTNYLQAVEQLLITAGISLYLSTPTEYVLATDREDWPVGTPYIEVINALLSEINYAPIWFDADGYAVIMPVKSPSAENLDHQYGETQNVHILKRACSIEVDTFDAPNVFVVICSNPDLATPIMATAINDNPLSSFSTFKRGRRIVQVYSVDNIPSQTALNDYAQRICLESMMAEETVTISTANIPGHGVYDTIGIIHPDIFGLYQEVSWSLILGPGETMIHKLRRSVLI